MKPAFLEAPQRHTTAMRQDISPVDYASPITRFDRSSGWGWHEVIAAVVLVIVLAALLMGH